MKKKLLLLGATGSIGTTCLDILENLDQIEVVGITANSSVDRLLEIYSKHSPEFIHFMDDEAAKKARQKAPHLSISSEMDSLLEFIERVKPDLVLAAMVGNIGLLPVLKALENSCTVALANKETLVSAGHLVNEALRKYPDSKLIPVDSEHSALHQCLRGEDPKSITRLILTASGGAFRQKSLEELQKVTVQEALKHPNWDMGAKITVDSSSLMNKGLEVIEAHWLFHIPYDQIEVVIHPQSTIHSLVEFHDRSLMAQLGLPDMSIPIAYALNEANRVNLRSLESLDLVKMGRLDFECPDFLRFPNLDLAFQAGKTGGSLPTVLNAANEIAVQAFLEEKISFLQISELNRKAMESHRPIPFPNLGEILDVDQETRIKSKEFIKQGILCSE